MGQPRCRRLELILDNVFIPNSNIVGKVRAGWANNRNVLNYSRPGGGGHEKPWDTDAARSSAVWLSVAIPIWGRSVSSVSGCSTGTGGYGDQPLVGALDDLAQL